MGTVQTMCASDSNYSEVLRSPNLDAQIVSTISVAPTRTPQFHGEPSPLDQDFSHWSSRTAFQPKDFDFQKKTQWQTASLFTVIWPFLLASLQ